VEPTRYTVPEDVLSAHLEGEAVLLNVETKNYYRLNSTASRIECRQYETPKDSSAWKRITVAAGDAPSRVGPAPGDDPGARRPSSRACADPELIGASLLTLPSVGPDHVSVPTDDPTGRCSVMVRE
jgi:hypothetical protein